MHWSSTYQKYLRKRIAEVEKLIEDDECNRVLPIIRQFLLLDLLHTQIKYFNKE